MVGAISAPFHVVDTSTWALFRFFLFFVGDA